MGRYKAEAVVMRNMERLTILFKDEETIWAFPNDGSTNVVFHRWFESRWCYGQWSAFRNILWRRPDLDIYDCYDLAQKYNIATMGTARLPNIKGKKLKLKFERRKPWERGSQTATKTG